MYVSDSSAAQYKNQKHFINIIYHEQDFGLFAEWHFCATSHGKGPANVIEGTVKGLAAKASLQREYNNQIQTPSELFNYCSSNMNNSTFFYVQEEQILNYGTDLIYQLQHQELKLITVSSH
jgi:hypothetical protein